MHDPQVPAADGPDRMAGGKIAETWEVWDALGVLQQIGVVPA